MDQLSTDVITLIVKHLFDDEAPSKQVHTETSAKQPRRSLYAIPNRRWQAPVESHTFASIRLISSAITDFTNIFSASDNGVRRRRCLQTLELDVELPSYTEAQCAERESAAEQQANSVAFERDVRALFSLLKTWEPTVPVNNVALHVRAHASMDRGYRGKRMLMDTLDEDRYREHALAFADSGNGAEPLPTLRMVKSFKLPNATRSIEERTVMLLLAALSEVESVFLEITEAKVARVDARRRQRNELSQGLSDLKASTLTDLKIYFESSEPANHSFEIASMNDPSNPGKDSISAALNQLASSQLVNLHLSGPFLISPSLFTATSDWPTLQNLVIDASILTPDGKWYYTGAQPAAGAQDSDDSDDEEENDGYLGIEEDRRNGNYPYNVWRTSPDPETFNPLIQALATAVLRMPSLRSLELGMGVNMPQPCGVELRYLARGEAAKPAWRAPDSEDTSRRRVLCSVGSQTTWHVPREIKALWREWAGSDGIILQDQWP